MKKKSIFLIIVVLFFVVVIPIGILAVDTDHEPSNLMISRYDTVNGSRVTTSERYFWVYRQSIEHIIFNNVIDESSITISSTCGTNNDELCKWDVSKNRDNSVMAYLSDTGNGFYDLYLMANGYIYAPQDSFALFGALRAAYGGFGNVTSIVNLNYLKTDYVTDMSSFFKEMQSIESIDLNSFNTSKVTLFDSMFEDCFSLVHLDLCSFDTSSATSLAAMFNKATGLESLDLTSFDTSNVTNMNYMFKENTSIQSIDVSSFNTSKVTTFIEMFSTCPNLKTIYASDTFVTTKITSSGTRDIFKELTSLVGGNGTVWKSSYASNKTYARIDTASTPGFFTFQTSMKSCSYSIKDTDYGKIIIGADEKTIISEFLNNILTTNNYLEVYDLDDNKITNIDSDIVKTGMKIKFTKNNINYDEAIIVVRGDINGDGYIDVSDLTILSSHLNNNNISDYRLYAMDVDYDINILIDQADKQKLSKYILGFDIGLNDI